MNGSLVVSLQENKETGGIDFGLAALQVVWALFIGAPLPNQNDLRVLFLISRPSKDKSELWNLMGISKELNMDYNAVLKTIQEKLEPKGIVEVKKAYELNLGSNKTYVQLTSFGRFVLNDVSFTQGHLDNWSKGHYNDMAQLHPKYVKGVDTNEK